MLQKATVLTRQTWRAKTRCSAGKAAASEAVKAMLYADPLAK
jgi:hypothetical protein